jgi:hypothetical protein
MHSSAGEGEVNEENQWVVLFQIHELFHTGEKVNE